MGRSRLGPRARLVLRRMQHLDGTRYISLFKSLPEDRWLLHMPRGEPTWDVTAATIRELNGLIEPRYPVYEGIELAYGLTTAGRRVYV